MSLASQRCCHWRWAMEEVNHVVWGLRLYHCSSVLTVSRQREPDKRKSWFWDADIRKATQRNLGCCLLRTLVCFLLDSVRSHYNEPPPLISAWATWSRSRLLLSSIVSSSLRRTATMLTRARFGSLLFSGPWKQAFPTDRHLSLFSFWLWTHM